MTIPLLKALPELKRKEYIPYKMEGYQDMKEVFNNGYNQAISELEKYEFCEEELAKIIRMSSSSLSISEYESESISKSILASLPAWLIRKES